MDLQGGFRGQGSAGQLLLAGLAVQAGAAGLGPRGQIRLGYGQGMGTAGHALAGVEIGQLLCQGRIGAAGPGPLEVLLGAAGGMAEAELAPAAQQRPQLTDLGFTRFAAAEIGQELQCLPAQWGQRIAGEAGCSGLEIGGDGGVRRLQLGSPVAQGVQRAAAVEGQPGRHGCGSRSSAWACCQKGEARKVSMWKGIPSRWQLRHTCSRKCTGRRTSGRGQAEAARPSTARARA